jgi:uncharacterized protein (TIGR02145 family)
VLSNQLVKVRFSIRDSAANGTVVYQEMQTPTTNTQGLINLFAGQGTAVTGTFAGINWGSKSKFLQTEIDITGGSNYTDMGTMQLMSVPYALYANSANSATKADTALYAANTMQSGSIAGQMMYWNGISWVNVSPGSYGQGLIFCDGVPTWGGCSPKITTTAASEVSYSTATTGGNVTTEGGVSVTSRGVCWSTTLNPTIALTTKTVNGSGAGSFTSSITGLTPNTLYHVRAYATNSVGTSYGADLTLTTLATVIPTVTTTAISSILNTTATSGGNVSSDGGADITARGICWSTSANPIITLTTKTVDGTGTGSFTSSITGLAANTLYYVRAYATNSVGTSYGTQQTFTSESVAVLPSVTIGSQVWTNQNLNVVTYRNGDIIPQVTDPTQWANLTTGAWCWYNNNDGFGYGRLYNWYAVNDSRGLAPFGWHVPSKTEWETLSSYLGGPYSAGNAMKLSSDWYNFGGNNSSGFKALPSGFRQYNGIFADITLRTHFWTTTETNNLITSHYYLFRDTNSPLNNSNDYKTYGFSIRLIRD